MAVNKLHIVVTGLSRAGKTTFVQRIISGEFTEVAYPTLGVNTEICEYEGYTLQIFDLGGHESLRELLWENYVKLSEGIIFIFDSSDSPKMEEARKSFWQVVDWVGSEDVTIAFVANKWDLPHLDLKEIAEGLELRKLGATPERSFRIFSTSAKTGDGVDVVMQWMVSRLARVTATKQINVCGLFLVQDQGIIFEMPLDLSQEAADFIKGFLLGMMKVFGSSGGQAPQVLETEGHLLTIVQRENMTCVVVAFREGSTARARIIAESIIRFQKRLFEKDPNYDPNAIANFVFQAFPDAFGPAKPSMEKRILLIEDNEDHAFLLKRVSQRYYGDALQFKSVPNATLALKELESPGNALLPHLILLDLRLPDVDGMDLLARLKKKPEFAKVPVVVVTASDKPEEVARAYSLGAMGFVQKPTTFGEYAEKIHAVLKFLDQIAVPG
ncbi:MAG: ADP-ribosylation factor-like protein [Candidatus Heimdallarchaeota archaeon]